jgi:hypothetical protein
MSESTLVALHATLQEAERFIGGFEGDESQEEPVTALLADLRTQIQVVEGAIHANLAIAASAVMAEQPVDPVKVWARPPVYRRSHTLANGRLYRAIVSLPLRMCPKGETFHERIVFFDGPIQEAGDYLEELLAHAWHIDTAGWCRNGDIYNIDPAFELIEQGEGADLDVRLFEIGWGGPEGVIYADPEHVDLFVAPMLKARLQAALAQISGRVVEGGAA